MFVIRPSYILTKLQPVCGIIVINLKAFPKVTDLCETGESANFVKSNAMNLQCTSL